MDNLLVRLIRPFTNFRLNFVLEPLEQKGFQGFVAGTGEGAKETTLLCLLESEDGFGLATTLDVFPLSGSQTHGSNPLYLFALID